MKTKLIIFQIAFITALNAVALPIKWRVNLNDTQSKTFTAYHGETLEFDTTFVLNGQDITPDNLSIFWQTNGMNEAWWSSAGTTFAPSNDVGAAQYRFFIRAEMGEGVLYRANGTLKMIDSPGFTPNTLALPKICLYDFSTTEQVSNIVNYAVKDLASKSYVDDAIDNVPQPDLSQYALKTDVSNCGTSITNIIQLQGQFETRLDSAETIVESTSANVSDLTTQVEGIDYNVNRINLQMNGSNVWFSVTNYMRQTDFKPSLSLLERRDGEINIVWDEKEKLDELETKITNEISSAVASVRNEIPSTAWGAYNSLDGAVNPEEDSVWMNNKRLVIASSLEWTSIIDGNDYNVLTSTDPTSLGYSTNGIFRVSTPDAVLFEFVRSEGYTVGAAPTDMINLPGNNSGFLIKYRTNVQPTLKTTRELKDASWQDENIDNAYHVSWTYASDEKGPYYGASVIPESWQKKGFFRAVVSVEGKSVMKVNGVVNAEQGIMAKDGVHSVRPVVNGNTVTWEVVP